jgi:hypothetical protein
MAIAPRRVPGVFLFLLTLLSALLVVGGTAGPAQAADGYKYWNYFHVENGKYVFAKTGPADYQPKDGAVEAYRYGLSSTADGVAPRTEATTYSADDICKGVTAEKGQKRVGVLIDYGTAEDAGSGETPPEPRAACAAVPTKANGQQVLDAVADLRVENQLTCGIDGYPVKGCSVTVKNPPAAAAQTRVDFTLPKSATEQSDAGSTQTAEQSDDGGFPWTLVVVVVVVLVLAGAGLAVARRGRNA